MEGNKYFLPLKNEKRFTPYEFDNMMSRNENRMDTLGKIIDQDIYNCMMADRKTPLVLTPKLILDNGNGMNAIRPKIKTNNFNSQSQQIFKNPLREVSNESFRILQNPRHMNSMQRQQFINEENNMINNNKELQQNLDDQYTRIDPEQQLNSHWKYDGPSSFNLEKKHYPRMSNNESYYKNDEPIKINHTDFNIDTYNRNENPAKYYNNQNNNTFKSQDFSRSRSNNYMRRRPTPYNEEYDDRNVYVNNRYNNNDNYDEGNNREFRNRSFRAFNTERNEDLKENKNNDVYTRRGNYNSQLNFPYDRYE